MLHYDRYINKVSRTNVSRTLRPWQITFSSYRWLHMRYGRSQSFIPRHQILHKLKARDFLQWLWTKLYLARLKDVTQWNRNHPILFKTPSRWRGTSEFCRQTYAVRWDILASFRWITLTIHAHHRRQTDDIMTIANFAIQSQSSAKTDWRTADLYTKSPLFQCVHADSISCIYSDMYKHNILNLRTGYLK